MRGPRATIVRARQRDRAGSLLGFDEALHPTAAEWGVDQLQVRVGGAWRSQMSGEDLFSARLCLSNWFTVPDFRLGRLTVETRERASTTLGRLELTINSVAARNGTIQLRLSCNPTRTLAHLLAAHGSSPDFRERLCGMSPEEFFAAAPEGAVPFSIDGNDNWLPDPRLARTRLGVHVFEAFLPIYVQQLQYLISLLLSENAGEIGYDGNDHLLRSLAGEIRIGWGQVQAPQIESYFERFHRTAVLAVSRAGIATITNDHRSTLRRYSGEADFERDLDCFRLSITVGKGRSLVVYAKTADRIRFEIRRRGRGRYEGLPNASAAEDRLLNILAHERAASIAVVRWPDVGRQFAEPSAPYLIDLMELLSAVLRALDLPHQQVREIVERLISDGGFSATSPENGSILDRLARAGVVERVRLRRRDEANRARRYSLAGPYRDLRERLLNSFANEQPGPLTQEVMRG